MEKIFVDKDIKIFRGEEASKLLSGKNDSKFLEDGDVKKVDDDRWKEAQDYERNTWCFSEARVMSTDRNEDHKKNFGGYSQLNFLIQNNPIKTIELGCGPFTNLRLIIPELAKSISEITLLDPLLNDYIKHTKHCAFKNGSLMGKKTRFVNSAIEDFEVDQKYDLIVMINVLEHCKDIDLIFQKILEMMHEDSIFLFNDVAYREEDIEKLLSNYWNCGHPIILSQKILRQKNRILQNYI
jgi:SAM-dependent methyltransferase